MDDEVIGYLWALKLVNEGLLNGLKVAVHVLEEGKDLPDNKRRSMINSLKQLISQVEEIYSHIPESKKLKDLMESKVPKNH